MSIDPENQDQRAAAFSPLEAGLRGELAPPLVDWERAELLLLRSLIDQQTSMISSLFQLTELKNSPFPRASLDTIRELAGGMLDYLQAQQNTSAKCQGRAWYAATQRAGSDGE